VKKTRNNVDVFLETMGQHFSGVPEHVTSSAKTRAGRKEILGKISELIEA
jgi:hypothetical protein